MPRGYAGRSMAGNQPVPVRRAAARSAILILLEFGDVFHRRRALVGDSLRIERLRHPLDIQRRSIATSAPCRLR